MEVSQGSGVCAAFCIWWFLLFWLSFDCFWLFLTNSTLYQSSKTLKTIGVLIVTGLPRLYQQCTNGVPIVKNSQIQSKNSQNSKNDHWCTNRHMFTKTVPAVYQQCTNRQKQSKTVKTQSKQHKTQSKQKKNDHLCTCRHMSTKTVPTVYQQCTKNSQNSENDHWCTNRHRSTKTVPTV